MNGDGEVMHLNDVSTDMTQASISKQQKHSLHTEYSVICSFTLIVSLTCQ